MNDPRQQNPADNGVGSTGGSAPGESPELAAAYANLLKAAEEYGKLAPKMPEPTEPPRIVPTLLHTAPGSFRPGYNIRLDSGGYMPGKIPVIALPARFEDIRRYKRFGTLGKFLRHLGLE